MPIPSRKTCLRWTLFLSVLVGIGAAIYHFEPREPLWTAGPLKAIQKRNHWRTIRPASFSRDGRHVYTLPDSDTEEEFDGISSGAVNALEIWDAATGVSIGQHPKVGRLCGVHGFSNDRRYYAADFRRPVAERGGKLGHFLCIADLEAETESEIALESNKAAISLRFSRCGKYLAVVVPEAVGEQTTLHLLETSTGKLLTRRPTLDILNGETMTSEHLVHYLLNDNGRQVEVWSITEGKVVGLVPHLQDSAMLSPDGKLLLLKQRAPIGEDGIWRVWNLATQKVQAEFNANNTWSNSIWITPNSQWAVVRCGDKAQTLQLHDLVDGKRLATLSAENLGHHHAFSPDSRFLAFSDRYSLLMSPGLRKQHGLRMIGLAEFKEVWTADPDTTCSFAFTSDSQTLLYGPNHADHVQFLNVNDGKESRKIDMRGRHTADVHYLEVSRDGKHLLVTSDSAAAMMVWFFVEDPWWKRSLRWIGIDPGRFENSNRDLTIVYDLGANRECLRLPGIGSTATWMSDDGRTLITTHEVNGERVMRCWAVDGWKPLRWPIGASLASGAVLFALAKLWTRWRKRRVATPVPPPEKS